MQQKPSLYLGYFIWKHINTEDFKEKIATQLKGNNSVTKKSKAGIETTFWLINVIIRVN